MISNSHWLTAFQLAMWSKAPHWQEDSSQRCFNHSATLSVETQWDSSTTRSGCWESARVALCVCDGWNNSAQGQCASRAARPSVVWSQPLGAHMFNYPGKETEPQAAPCCVSVPMCEWSEMMGEQTDHGRIVYASIKSKFSQCDESARSSRFMLLGNHYEHTVCSHPSNREPAVGGWHVITHIQQNGKNLR